MRGDSRKVDWWVIVIDESKKYGMTPWQFSEECSQLWWNRIIEYPKLISRYGNKPDWVFTKKEADDRGIAPWVFEEQCSQEWADRMSTLGIATAEHYKFAQKRLKNLAKLKKHLRGK